MTFFNVSCLCRLWVLRQDDKVLLEVGAVGWDYKVYLTRDEAEELANLLVDFPWDRGSAGVGKGVLVLPKESDMLLIVGNARILLDDAQADKVSVALSEASGHYVGGRSENKAPASKARKPVAKKRIATRKAPARRKTASKTSSRQCGNMRRNTGTKRKTAGARP